MDIGIIGAGNIGAALARLFAAAGHRVMVSNSRGPDTLRDLVADLGEGVRAGTAEAAAAFGEVVVEAIPYGRLRDLPRDAIGGKILVTASNYYPGRDGEIDLDGRSESELVAARLPDARVVKAFNTIWYRHLASQGDPDAPLEVRRAIFVAGDDADAKRVVAGLIETIGFGAVDTGSLADSTVQQPGTAIYNEDLTVAEARARLGA